MKAKTKRSGGYYTAESDIKVSQFHIVRKDMVGEIISTKIADGTEKIGNGRKVNERDILYGIQFEQLPGHTLLVPSADVEEIT